MTLIVAGPFFLVGLAFVVPALIWGQRPAVPDLPKRVQPNADPHRL